MQPLNVTEGEPHIRQALNIPRAVSRDMSRPQKLRSQGSCIPPMDSELLSDRTMSCYNPPLEACRILCLLYTSPSPRD
eukprot:6936414-Alexandrium_andersonii.AAC.1